MSDTAILSPQADISSDLKTFDSKVAAYARDPLHLQLPKAVLSCIMHDNTAVKRIIMQCAVKYALGACAVKSERRMIVALQDWLLPNEDIKYTAPEPITYTGLQYRFYSTSERILLHAVRGVFFPKESVATERLADIISMNYEEQGIIQKWGILKVETKDKKTNFAGRPETIKAIWQTLQQYIRRS